jgi:hypothetical protein
MKKEAEILSVTLVPIYHITNVIELVGIAENLDSYSGGIVSTFRVFLRHYKQIPGGSVSIRP